MVKESQTRLDGTSMKKILAPLPNGSPDESDRRIHRVMVNLHQGIAMRDLADFAAYGLFWSIEGILKSVLGRFSPEKR